MTPTQIAKIVKIADEAMPRQFGSIALCEYLEGEGYKLTNYMCKKIRNILIVEREQRFADLVEKIADKLSPDASVKEIKVMALHLGYPDDRYRWKKLYDFLSERNGRRIKNGQTTRVYSILSKTDEKLLKSIQHMTGLEANDTLSFVIRGFALAIDRHQVDLSEMAKTSRVATQAEIERIGSSFDMLNLSGEFIKFKSRPRPRSSRKNKI